MKEDGETQLRAFGEWKRDISVSNQNDIDLKFFQVKLILRFIFLLERFALRHHFTIKVLDTDINPRDFG